MGSAFPGESPEYRKARDTLLEREREQRRELEAVAAERRELPPGGIVAEDYVFVGAEGDVRFTELFEPGKDTLVVYNFMYPRSPEEDLPCPSCTQFLDSFDGVARHATQRVNLAIIAKAAYPRLAAHAADRGWRFLQLLSSAGNAYKHDYLAEAGEQQLPMLSVFSRDGEVIRHAWSSELLFEPVDPGLDPRHADTIDALWQLFDLVPEGRGTDWYPALRY